MFDFSASHRNSLWCGFTSFPPYITVSGWHWQGERSTIQCRRLCEWAICEGNTLILWVGFYDTHIIKKCVSCAESESSIVPIIIIIIQNRYFSNLTHTIIWARWNAYGKSRLNVKPQNRRHHVESSTRISSISATLYDECENEYYTHICSDIILLLLLG